MSLDIKKPKKDNTISDIKKEQYFFTDDDFPVGMCIPPISHMILAIFIRGLLLMINRNTFKLIK